jgi:hypothetical protein
MAVELIFVARRRPDLTHAEFDDYWINRHAPLVRSLADTCRIRRYIQSVTLDTPVNAEFAQARGMAVEEPPDGVAEVWWDSLDGLAAGFSGSEGEKAAQLLVEDEAKFCDFSTSRAWITEERQIV